MKVNVKQFEKVYLFGLEKLKKPCFKDFWGNLKIFESF